MQTPAPHPLLAAPRSDGKILKVAFLCALAVHVAVLLTPWKKDSYILELPPDPGPIVLVPIDIKPPELPEMTVVEIETRVRRVPIPAADPEPEMLEPVEEAISPDLPAPFYGDEELLFPDDVEPPAPGVHDSWERDLVLPVRLSGSADPEYPGLGVASRMGGTVMLQAVVDRTGRVVELELLRAPVPDPGFSEAAMKAVSSWRYRPGTINGRPVAVRMSVVVEFSLR